jgi:hypothetical protein
LERKPFPIATPLLPVGLLSTASVWWWMQFNYTIIYIVQQADMIKITLHKSLLNWIKRPVFLLPTVYQPL